MALNRQKTWYSRPVAAPITSGVTIENEGMVLVGVREDGVLTVRPSAGSTTYVTGIDGVKSGTEQVYGFSYNTSLRAKTRVEQALVTIPTFTSGVGTVSLPRTALNASSVRAVLTASNTALTVTEVTAAPTSVTAGTVSVWLDKGILYFNAAQSAASVLLTYRFTLNAEQVALFVREAHVNANSSPFLNSIQVIRGNGDVFTDWFDTAQDYSTATKLYAGPNGLVTSLATDGTLYFAEIPGAELLQAPTIDDDANLTFGVTIGFTFNVG